ncbi:MAG TPA: hypothetical protein VE571_06150 [Solirubrobacteraceae bacterium]|nr:hypothetical protein [Solirubrobacteraceae bacterium]
MIKRRRACALAVAAGIAVAGCGSGGQSSTSSQPGFKSGFATTQRNFRQLGTDIAKDITGAGKKTDAAIADEFRKLATRAGRQAAQLDALHAPARYRNQVAKMFSGFHAVKDDLSNIATAATNHNASNAEAATRELLHDAATIKSADNALSKSLGLPAPGGSSTSTSPSG